MPSERLAEAIGELEKTGLPHRTLMRKLRLNRSTLYNWRRGTRSPMRSTLLVVANGLREYAREMDALADKFQRLTD